MQASGVINLAQTMLLPDLSCRPTLDKRMRACFSLISISAKGNFVLLIYTSATDNENKSLRFASKMFLFKRYASRILRRIRFLSGAFLKFLLETENSTWVFSEFGCAL